MSLDNFRNRTIIWDTVNKDFPQPIQIMQGDVNARTLLVKIVDNGLNIDLSGHSLKLTYQYTENSNSGFVMIPPKDLTKGEFILVIPTEMTKIGVIDANLILLNENLKQVIVSKNLTFVSNNSTVTDLAQEVNNKIDDFTKLLLENMPQVMRSELNDLHAQTDSNTKNIELKANLADVTSLQNAMTNLQNEVESFGITPENLVTIKSLLDAIASNASQSQVVELINSVNVLTNNISLMSNGDYSPKANRTDLESLQSVVNNQSATIATKATQTDLENLKTTITSQGIEISTARGTSPTLNVRLNKMDDKDVEITAQLAQNILLKNDEFEIGAITGNTPVPNLTRVRMKNMLHVYKGDIIKFQKDQNLVKYGISISDLNGVWRGVDYGWLGQPEFIIKEDSLIKLVARYVDNRVLDENTLKTLTENTFTIVRSIRNYVDDKFNNIDMDTVKKNTAISSILVEYGRINGASYVFARIPKTMNNGSKLVPKVALTSIDGSLSGTKRSALNYARDKDTIFTLNAGLFNVSTVQPVGQLIIDGVSIINTPMTSDNGVPIHPDECYPLAIDRNGNLTTYPKNADTADMIANGVKYAVTAWGKLVDNFEITTIDIDNEIVHNGTKYIRQSIGQYQNGDYCVCSVDMTRGSVTNEAGLYYKELAQLFVDKGVKFAYSLDGGGSTETVIGKRQLNPIYEGSDGRAVPTVITFEIVN